MVAWASRSPPGVYGFTAKVVDAQQAAVTKPLSIYVPVSGCYGAPLRINGPAMTFHYDFVSAYARATNNDDIQLKTLDIGGDLVLDRNLNISLTGGRDCGFSATTSLTRLSGKLGVTGGTVNLDQLRFR